MAAGKGLPTAKQIEQSVQDDDACRSLVLQVLSHGTGYDIWPRSDEILQQTKEAGDILVGAFEAAPSLQSLLVDALWMVGSLVGPDNEALIEIIHSLITQVPNRQDFWIELQAHLEPEVLEAVKLLPPGGKEILLKKVRKVNTETHYRQQKFNLLQEESEGYAKVISLLISIVQASSTNTASSHLVSERLRDYIGTFELDPNRILDLVLDVLESHIQSIKYDGTSSIDEASQTLIDVIGQFSLAKVPHLMGFKLHAGAPVEASLYYTCIFLVKKGLMQLRDLRPHLPSSQDIIKAHQVFCRHERLQIQAMGRIRLNADDGNKEDPKLIEGAKQVQESKASLETNPLVGLVKVLLELKEWDLADGMLDCWGPVCTLLPESAGELVCRLVEKEIRPLFEAIVETPSLSLDKAAARSEANSSDPSLNDLSLEQVSLKISKPLSAIVESGCIASCPILYCQLCRLLGKLLETKGSTDSLSSVVHSVVQNLVSAISLFAPNPGIAADLWSVLSILPYPTRYHLYQDWKGAGLERKGLSSKPLALVRCEMEAGKAARYALKRLSKENVRDMGRQISKESHSNPLVVFSLVLNQIESYDNLIDMMVESVKFVTPLGLDVLGYCILSRLGGTTDGKGRSLVKDDGVNATQWLSSLESFTGTFYRRCPEVECRGIFRFIIRRLVDGHVLELGVLKTLLKTAGGYGFADYSPVASLAAAQMEGRSGSQMLKRETCAFGVVEQSNLRAARRLRTVLQDDNMGVTILILLAQIRGKIVFDSSKTRPKHVKLIGNLYDTCQVAMEMLLEFLTDTSDEDPGSRDSTKGALSKYAESLPSLGDLHGKYGLDTESAWMLCRPLCRGAMADGDEPSKNKKSAENAIRSYLPSSKVMRKVYTTLLAQSVWTQFSSDLLEVFGSHSLYDISFPETSYEAEITRLKKEEERLVQRQKGNAGLQTGQHFSQADDMELARTRRNITSLSSDRSTQKDHLESTRQSIAERKDSFFLSKAVSISSVQSFLAHCFYPRCLGSPDDALYCARFVSLLHELATPGFSTMHFFDELVNILSGALFSVTESEAATMGIVLLETWKDISRWRYDEQAFETEVVGTPGSFMVQSGNSEGKAVSHKDYIMLYNKWHAELGAAVLGGLQSSEYMHTRASLVVLTRIVEVYPTRPGLGQRLIDDALPPLQDDSNPLQDIKTTAQAYGMLIAKARADGVWKEEDAAVAKEREEKEKAALAERKKKAEEQFAEMKRESDKITSELGESDTRGRDDRRRGPGRGPSDLRRSPMNANGAFPPDRRPRGDSYEHRPPAGRDRAPPPRTTEMDRPGPDGRRREGHQVGPSRDPPRRNVRGDDAKGLEGRWQQGGTKRDHSPGRDDQPGKRPREGPMHHDSRRDGGNRDDRGARRGPPPPPLGSSGDHGGARRSERRAPPRR